MLLLLLMVVLVEPTTGQLSLIIDELTAGLLIASISDVYTVHVSVDTLS